MKFIMWFALSILIASPCFAADENLIRSGITTDMSMPFSAPLTGRTCLDGKPVTAPDRQLIEYWVDLECYWCQLPEVEAFQKENQSMCVVVRHFPTSDLAVEKALIFETLQKQSPAAAAEFWNSIVPKNEADPLGDSGSTHALLETLIEKHKLDQIEVMRSLQNDATQNLGTDRLAGMNKIDFTPTVVIDGIRLGACSFSRHELPQALELVKKVKAGDTEALDELVKIVGVQQDM